MSIKKSIKGIAKKIIFREKGSSQAYIKWLRKKGCEIGAGTYIYDPPHTLIDSSGAAFIKIGKNVQISRGGVILGHDYSYSILSSVFYDMPRVQKRTIIGDNVFIGMNAVILMGSHIGDNVIIGAGAVVSGQIESDSVYAGNPAKKICTLTEHYQKCVSRFEDSAHIYAEEFRRINGRWPHIREEEFAAYKTLFYSDTESFQPNIGILEECIEKINVNMKKNAVYDSWEDFRSHVKKE